MTNYVDDDAYLDCSVSSEESMDEEEALSLMRGPIIEDENHW